MTMFETVHEHTDRSLCLVPRLAGAGGMVSFQVKLARGLAQREIKTTFALDASDVGAVLVISGTRDLPGLWRVRRRGVPVFQRLDGINWIHKQRRTGLRHYLKAERANLLLALIRNYFATGVIYQSHFVHRWWERKYGPTSVQHAVVHNGVDLERYSPEGPSDRPEDTVRILVVEGHLAGGYEIGLVHAIGFAEALAARHPEPIELMVVGEASEAIRRSTESRTDIKIRWAGLVPEERIPEIDRSAHLLYAADIHPACPNSVIEALACGLPVVGFDTGALSEIVDERSGCVVSYGSDSWNLERPDFDALAQGAGDVLADLQRFRDGARTRAVGGFGLDRMVDGYLEAIGW